MAGHCNRKRRENMADLDGSGAAQTLTKRDSQAIKGIAIWLMLFHHLFQNPDAFHGMPVTFFAIDLNIMVSFAGFAKICVPLFVFITAYGLAAKYRQTEWSMEKIERITVKRYFHFMIPYWLIFAIMQVICNVAGIQSFTKVYGGGLKSGIYFLFDAFGLAHCLGTPTINVTWWYMSLALLLICIMPFIWKGVLQAGWLLFAGCFLLFQMAGWEELGCFDYILVAILGVTVYEQGFFGKIGKVLKYKKLLRIAFFLVCIVAILGSWALNREGLCQDIVFCMSTLAIALMQQQYFSRMRWLTKTLSFFGTHAMNIFLIHTFIKTWFFHDFIYSFRFGLLICVALMLTSLIASFCIIFLKKVLFVDRLVEKIDLKFTA